jgi:hypothetical protein
MMEIVRMETETMFAEWIVIDGVYGVSVYPEDYFSEGEALADYLGTDRLAENIGKVEECETVKGWCARLSMPGYLDCTEWFGPFTSEQSAADHIHETYIED